MITIDSHIQELIEMAIREDIPAGIAISINSWICESIVIMASPQQIERSNYQSRHISELRACAILDQSPGSHYANEIREILYVLRHHAQLR